MQKKKKVKKAEAFAIFVVTVEIPDDFLQTNFTLKNKNMKQKIKIIEKDIQIKKKSLKLYFL